MSKQPPTASTLGPCPSIIQIVGRPGTGNLPRTACLLEVATKTGFAVHSLEKDGLRQAELCPRDTMMLRQDTLAEYPDGDCSHF